MNSLKIKELLLYSTGTKLSYKINKKYYNNIHFVWCTESFDAALQPGTSNPRTLCTRYLEQIIKNDKHALEISNNKTGILKGATIKLEEGVIDKTQYDEICAKVACAENEDFYPVIYLINKKAVSKRLKIVDSKDKANNTSIEYIIEDLQQNEFELIKLEDVLSGVVYPIED